MLGTLNSLKLKILKLAYNRNHCIDFSQILDSDKDRQIVFVGGPNRRTTNPRWRTATILKIENGHIATTVWPIGKKFGIKTHIGPRRIPAV